MHALSSSPDRFNLSTLILGNSSYKGINVGLRKRVGIFGKSSSKAATGLAAFVLHRLMGVEFMKEIQIDIGKDCRLA
jgi:hypothetical protein